MQFRSLALLLVLFVSCEAREHVEAVSDPRLLGTWQLISNKFRKFDDPNFTILWRFDDKSITVIEGTSDHTTSKSDYSVTESTALKLIDMEIESEEKETRLGIYEIRDDKLLIMMTIGGDPRPDEMREEEAMIFVRASK